MRKIALDWRTGQWERGGIPTVPSDEQDAVRASQLGVAVLALGATRAI
jgi:hypothetical protein